MTTGESFAGAPSYLPKSATSLVSFRPVRPDRDVEPMARIWDVTQYAVYEDPAEILDLAGTKAYLETVLLPLHAVWVATFQGEAIAFIATRSGHVAQLHVAPSWQGRGIGKRLLGIAQAESSGQLTLACYREKVGAFYRKQGFRESHIIEESQEGIYAEYRWQAERELTPQEITTL
jgi:GNAT superfamily N-acetyltransferase